MARSTAWKAVERWYCRDLGGDRRGADYGDIIIGGMNDCVSTPRLSVEIKSWAKPSSTAIRKDAEKAEARAKKDQFGIAITHWKGTRYHEGLVTLKYPEFKKLYTELMSGEGFRNGYQQALRDMLASIEELGK